MEIIEKCRFVSCRLAAAVMAATLLSPEGAVAAEPQNDLRPHRAVYDAKLYRADAASGISSVSGTMVAALEKTCDGWIMAQQLGADVSLANGLTTRQEIRFAGWESLDGLSYRFASRQALGRAEVAMKGSAQLTKQGGAGTATFEAPTRKTIDLPEGTVFPVAHTRILVEAARNGKKWDSRILFEGGGGAGPQRVTAFISAAKDPEPEAVKRLGPLLDQRAWPVRMAIFELDSQNAEPSFEIEALQLANGISRTLILDLGVFTLKLDLQSVEALAEPKC